MKILNESLKTVDISYLGDEAFFSIEGWELPKNIQHRLSLALRNFALDRIEILYNNYDMKIIDDRTTLSKVELDPMDLKEIGIVDLVVMPSPHYKTCFDMALTFYFETENRNVSIEKLSGISDIDAIAYIGYIGASYIYDVGKDIENFPEDWDLDKMGEHVIPFIQMILNSYKSKR